jgi:hypothetical protein
VRAPSKRRALLQRIGADFLFLATPGSAEAKRVDPTAYWEEMICSVRHKGGLLSGRAGGETLDRRTR